MLFRSVDAEIQVLSTNLANNGTRGEWGFAALVKTRVEGQDVEHCVLWDTGRYPETVLQNAISLGVDLSCVQDIVLSHFHLFQYPMMVVQPKSLE